MHMHESVHMLVHKNKSQKRKSYFSDQELQVVLQHCYMDAELQAPVLMTVQQVVLNAELLSSRIFPFLLFWLLCHPNTNH